jgi:hypothetical protein
MRSLVSLLLVCVLAAPAAADGVYFSESFGGSDVKDQLGARIDAAGRFRFAGGYRHGSWAVELWGGVLLGIEGARDTAPCSECQLRTTDGPSHDVYEPTIFGAYGLDVKYVQPLASHVEVYLRTGASELGGEVQGAEYAGRGLGVGAGLQLKGKVPAVGFLFWPLFFTGIGPKVTASLWADTGYDFYRLRPGASPDRLGSARPTIDAGLSTLSFGFGVGTDF